MPGFPGMARCHAGFVGCPQVFAGLAGIAGRQLVMHAGDLLFGNGQGGRGRGDLAAQRCGPFDQHAGVRWQLLQVLSALRCQPVDLRLVPRLPGRRTLKRGLAAVKAFPASGQPGPGPPDALKRLSLRLSRPSPEQSCPLVLPPLPIVGPALTLIGPLLPLVLPPVPIVGPALALLGLPLALLGEILTLVGHPVPLVSEILTLVGLVLPLVGQRAAPAGRHRL